MKCLNVEPDWDGVWVDPDTRADKVGCAYAYELKNCEGNPGGIPLTGSGKCLLNPYHIAAMSDRSQRKRRLTSSLPIRDPGIAEGRSNSVM
jgi:hypothetical protein